MNKLLSSTLALVVAFGSATAWAQDAKPGDKTAGSMKVQMCIGCHNIPGYQASFPEVFKVPKIAGQNAKYIVAALNAYKKGERKHPSMRAIATTLTDQDMADVAAYYEQLGKGGAAPAAPAEAPADIAKLLTKANCESCHGKNFSSPGSDERYLASALISACVNGRAMPIMIALLRPTRGLWSVW